MLAKCVRRACSSTCTSWLCSIRFRSSIRDYRVFRGVGRRLQAATRRLRFSPPHSRILLVGHWQVASEAGAAAEVACKAKWRDFTARDAGRLLLLGLEPHRKTSRTGALGLFSKAGHSLYCSTWQQLTRLTRYFTEVFSGECVRPQQQQMGQLTAQAGVGLARSPGTGGEP